jgi:hypothetical protein
MPSGQVSVGQDLFQLLDSAFETARQAQATAYARVTEIEKSLSSAWTSEQAQPLFRTALQNWLDGFRTLQSGMDDMQQSMNAYAGSTDKAEDEATTLSTF